VFGVLVAADVDGPGAGADVAVGPVEVVALLVLGEHAALWAFGPGVDERHLRRFEEPHTEPPVPVIRVHVEPVDGRGVVVEFALRERDHILVVPEHEVSDALVGELVLEPVVLVPLLGGGPDDVFPSASAYVASSDASATRRMESLSAVVASRTSIRATIGVRLQIAARCAIYPHDHAVSARFET